MQKRKRVKILKRLEYLVLFAIPLIIYLFYFEEDTGAYKKELSVQKAYEKIDAWQGDRVVVFDGKVFPLMEKVISEADKSVSISTYTISQNRLMKLLEEKGRRGLKINIAYGKSKDGYIPTFSQGPVKKKYGIFHSKFIVTDSENILITSANFGSDSKAVNNAVFFRNVPEVARILENEVEDASKDNFPKRCPEGCDTEIGRVFFTPGKACVNIKKELLEAERSIDVAVYTVTTRNPVVTGLKNVLKNKKADVRLVVDNWRGDGNRIVNRKAVNYFRSLGAQVKYDNTVLNKDPLFHHKFAVVDNETTVFGSLNWTSSGCYRNREIVVISKDEKIVDKFSEYFATVWKN